MLSGTGCHEGKSAGTCVNHVPSSKQEPEIFSLLFSLFYVYAPVRVQFVPVMEQYSHTHALGCIA